MFIFMAVMVFHTDCLTFLQWSLVAAPAPPTPSTPSTSSSAAAAAASPPQTWRAVRASSSVSSSSPVDAGCTMRSPRLWAALCLLLTASCRLCSAARHGKQEVRLGSGPSPRREELTTFCVGLKRVQRLYMTSEHLKHVLNILVVSREGSSDGQKVLIRLDFLLPLPPSLMQLQVWGCQSFSSSLLTWRRRSMTSLQLLLHICQSNFRQ